MRDGHACVVYDVSAEPCSAARAEGATGAASLEDFAAKLDPPRRAWVMLPAGDDHRDDRARARCPTARARATRSSTAATPITGTTSAARAELGGARDRLPRLRHERRRLRARARLLPHGRRQRRGVRSSSSRSSPRSRPAWTPRRARRAATGDAGAGGAGLPALRPGGRRALREDGAQRHRVRDDGRVRRRAQHPPPRRRRPAPSASRTPRRRRSSTPSSTPTTLDLPAIAEVWRRGSVVESWLLDLTAAALHESPRARGLRRARLRLGGRALDGDRRDRGGRAAPTCSRPRCSRASRPGRGRVRQQGALCHAQAVRRASGEADLVDERPATRARHPVSRRPELQGRRVRTRTRHARRRRAPRGQHRRSAGSTSTSRGPAGVRHAVPAPAPMFVMRWAHRIPSARRNEHTSSAASSFGTTVKRATAPPSRSERDAPRRAAHARRARDRRQGCARRPSG